MRRKTLVVLLVSAIGAAGIGCGGGDDETTSALTKAQYVKQANAICAKHNKEMIAKYTSLIREAGQLTPKVADEAVAKASVPGMKQQLEELRALPAPSGEEDKVEALLERRQEALEKVEADPGFKTSGDPFEEFNQSLTDYGLTECAL
jgi:hypothetical protein